MKNQFLMYLCIALLMGGVCLIQLNASAKATVINVKFQDGKEFLHGVLQKTQLEPPLRDDILHIRFSPDGKYVLAQDDAGINVITREPFALLFRIDATNVSHAQFSQDSQYLSFYDNKLRIQVWSVGQQNLKAEHDVAVTVCQQIELSPDGKTLACFASDGDLILFDVATNAELFRQKGFYKYPYEGMLVLDSSVFRNDSLDRRINMEFSPDGRYFAAGLRQLRQRVTMDLNRTTADATKTGYPNVYEADPNNVREGQPSVDVYRPDRNAESSKAVAVDLATRKQVSLGGSLKDMLAGNFIFLGPDRIVGTPKNGNSEIVMFPSGQTIAPINIDKVQMDAPARGDYLLMRPAGKYPVGVFDLKSGTLLMANKKPAIDLFDDVYVCERGDGDLGLYEVRTNALLATVQLPRGAFDNLQATALSPDFRWLAVSGSSRAAVWDLSKGERVFYLRSFDGAYYAADGTFYVDFPKQESVERTIGILQTEQRQVLPGQSIEDLEGARSEQYGQFFTINRRPDLRDNAARNASLEVRDVRTMKQLWIKTFAKQRPTLWVDATNETMVLGWGVTEEMAKAEIKRDNRLSKQLRAIKEKGLVYLYQILNASTGQQRGSILFDTEQGSLYVGYVIATNDSVVAVTSEGRICVYSLPSGEKRTEIAGTYATVARNANLLCVKSKKSQLTIYDLATLKERDQFTFSSPVAVARFSDDGKRLFVLTQSQTAYVLDLSSAGTSQKS